MNSYYKRTVAGSVGAGVGAIFTERRFYILEHKTESSFHHVGESQKIIVDQIELGRDSSCQVRFDESFETVSRRHAAIVREGENWKLISLSQTNATLVNGQPISGEWHLKSGDEIRLSTNGPIMGFIIPQGKSGLTNSIGFTERMGLFRQQALRPYKIAVSVISVILLLVIAGALGWGYIHTKNTNELAMHAQELQDRLDAPAKADAVYFEDLNNCNDAVYYVRMDNLAVYSPNNEEIVNFNTGDIIGGTGFLLEDGRFVTSNRVVEPWFYYKERVGRDNAGVNWSMRDIQLLAASGYKVVANYTAYSPSGTNFKFNSNEMTTSNSNISIDKERYTTSSNATLLRLLGNKSIYLEWYNSDYRSDWATMAKKDQLGVVKGLKFDNEASVKPKVNDEVKILGYPLKVGFVDSQNVRPIAFTNNVNVTDLNDEDIIELSSRRYQKGNSGAPVLVKKNNLWVVVGALCETDYADRDAVVPVAYMK